MKEKDEPMKEAQAAYIALEVKYIDLMVAARRVVEWHRHDGMHYPPDCVEELAKLVAKEAK